MREIKNVRGAVSYVVFVVVSLLERDHLSIFTKGRSRDIICLNSFVKNIKGV